MAYLCNGSATCLEYEGAVIEHSDVCVSQTLVRTGTRHKETRTIHDSIYTKFRNRYNPPVSMEVRSVDDLGGLVLTRRRHGKGLGTFYRTVP